MIYRVRLFLAALAAVIVMPIAAFAHGGGTDANGCHTNRKTGDYHCHGEVSVLRHRSQRHSLAEDRVLMPTAQQLALQVLRPFIAETLDTDPI